MEVRTAENFMRSEMKASESTTMKGKYMNKYEDGFLQQNMENCNSKGVCEGGCDFHEGELNTVRVIDPSGSGHDWGYYRYCEKAVQADKDRGFDVYFEGDELFKPNADITGGGRKENV